MLTDLLWPATDRAVFIQWGVAAVFWTVVVGATWRIDRELRFFVWGLLMMNLSWFALRALH